MLVECAFSILELLVLNSGQLDFFDEQLEEEPISIRVEWLGLSAVSHLFKDSAHSSHSYLTS